MAGISDLAKTRAGRILGLDCNTNSIAFCIYYNRKPIHWGKIKIEGADIYEKIGDANKKIYALYQTYDIDYVAIEGSVFVKSPQVAIQLAYVFGSIIGVLVALGCETITVAPVTWQSHIGNKILSKTEKDKLKTDNPGKSASWYQNTGRNMRKQRTMDFFNNKFNLDIKDNDVGDAMGIAYYAYYKLTTRT
jgi:Holliday junction resolvasome RuvABC endonuclease subunit